MLARRHASLHQRQCHDNDATQTASYPRLNLGKTGLLNCLRQTRNGCAKHGACPARVKGVIVTGLQQIGVPFWVENVVYGTALATGVGLSGRLTRLREEAARRSQLRALKEGRLAARPL